MLRSFIAWLDEYLAGEGPPALVKAVVGLLSFAALLGAVVGGLAVRAGALVVVVFAVVSLGLMLLANQRSQRRRIELAERLVVRCAGAAHATGLGYRMTSWIKTVVISANGDTTETLAVQAKVKKSDVQLFWLDFGCAWPQPVKYRHRVDVRVRNLLAGDVPGVSLDRLLCWLPDGRLAVIIHLHQPPKKGEDIRIKLEMEWPGKCAPLMQGMRDNFTVGLSKTVDRARYKIVLPKGCDAYFETIGFQRGDPGVEVASLKTDDGRSAYQIDAHDMLGGRQVGLSLELKQGAAVAVR